MMLPLLPLASLGLPLLGLLLVLLGNRRATVRQLTFRLVPLLILAAGAALLPRLGWSVRTPSLPWFHFGARPSDVAFAWRPGVDLFMSVVLLLGAGGIAAYGLRLGATVKTGAIILLGLLLVVTGSCLTIGATDALVAVVGVGVAGLGGLLIELASVPSDRGSTLSGILPLTAGCITLATATMWDPTLLTTTPLWAFGCLVTLLSGPARIERGRVPPWLRTFVLVLGLPMLGGWLLVHSITTTPAIWPQLAFVACSLGGALLLLGGTVWALTATRLGSILAGQWTAQLGLVGLALGGRGPALALLIHATWSTLVLGWALTALAQAAGTDRIADLPPFATPLRRIALIYGLAAASVVGLPLLAGYPLHAQLLTQLPGPLVAVVLGSNALLALAFVPPLVACVRRPAYHGLVTPVAEQGSGPAFFGALLLVLGNGWDAVRLLLLDRGRVDLPQTIIAGAIRVAGALLIVAVISRRLRQSAVQPVFAGGEPLDEEPGWALPWSGLRGVLLPTGGTRWQATQQAGQNILTRFITVARPITRLITQRYYLSLVVAVVIAVLLAVASGSGP